MHFWIDKRSQCAFGGRRVPSSISSGVGRPRGRVGHKAMAAPVHRFAALEPPPRRPTRSTRPNPPPAPVHSRRQQDEQSLYVEIPEQPTIASLAAARSVTPDTLLRTAALGLHHTPMMAPHLKFGLIVSFALATIFLAGARFYCERQPSVNYRGAAVVVPEAAKGESSRTAGLVGICIASAAGGTLLISLCRKRTPPLASPPERISSTGARHRAQSQQAPSEPSEDISLNTLTNERPSPASSEGPPPYHIAVLLPTNDKEEPPPPAYSALNTS